MAFCGQPDARPPCVTENKYLLNDIHTVKQLILMPISSYFYLDGEQKKYTGPNS